MFAGGRTACGHFQEARAPLRDRPWARYGRAARTADDLDALKRALEANRQSMTISMRSKDRRRIPLVLAVIPRNAIFTAIHESHPRPG
jgi:hypothetical protein